MVSFYYAVAVLLLVFFERSVAVKSVFRFIRYESCDWEKKWLANVHKWGRLSGRDWCDIVQDPEEKRYAEDALIGISEMSANNSTHLSDTPRHREIFSRFVYETLDVKGAVLTHYQLIEPLVQLLRYFGVCESQSDNLLNRGYLVFDSGKDLRVKIRQSMYIDLGASTYDSGAGGLSSKWFFESYKARGLPIDRALLWEINLHQPKDVFDQVPGEFFHAYQYFIIPVETRADHPKNPFKILKSIVRKHDFVAVKIDIDTPSIENELTDQLVENLDIMAPLIDEFFYEHHVRSPTMMRLGWGNTVTGELEDTYKLHLKLRNRGIRSHGWP